VTAVDKIPVVIQSPLIFDIVHDKLPVARVSPEYELV
jgi:hypothetical protein